MIRYSKSTSRKNEHTWMLLIVHFIILLVLIYTLMNSSESNSITEGWEQTIGWISFGLMLVQLISLFLCGYELTSFHIILIICFYIFMLGRIILCGVLGTQNIYALGYIRSVLDDRYSNALVYKSAVFILCCIQSIVFSSITKGKSKYESVNIYDDLPNEPLYNTGLVLLCLGVPCHLYYSIRMVFLTQTASSYNAITDMVGLIDDFANFLIPGLLCLFFSNRLSKFHEKTILYTVCIYLIGIMILSGDRRYQAISICVLLLAYIKKNNIKFGIKWLLYFYFTIVLLNLFMVIREIRYSHLTSLGDFFNQYGQTIISPTGGFVEQTLYEFGVSLYTVAAVIRYIPNIIGFRYGSTIINGLLGILPAGFLYQKWDIYRFGALTGTITSLAKSTIGGSIIEDFYGNFGYIGGIICAYICGCIIRVIFSSNSTNKQIQKVKYYTLFYALIHMARASFAEIIRTAAWGIIAIYIIYYFFGGEQQNTTKKNHTKKIYRYIK